MAPFEERVARNEALFREVNERVRELDERLRSDVEVGSFVCECGSDVCTETVEVPLAVYEEARANGRRFLVLPGHVLPEIEKVVDEGNGYVIVEKDTPTASRIAEQHDPRR
jgi:hypothetical protein